MTVIRQPDCIRGPWHPSDPWRPLATQSTLADPCARWGIEPSQWVPPQRLGRAGGQLRGAKLCSAGAPHPVVRAQLGPPSAVADLVPGRGVNLPDAKAARAAALRRPHVIVDQKPAGGGRSDVVVRGIVVRRSCLLHGRTVGAGGATFNRRKYRAARGRGAYTAAR
jgi:hypothetical protein